MGKLMGRHVLIVDDELDFLEAVKLILGGQQVEVTAVDNGRAAIEAIRQHHFDLVITDLRMPGLNGADIITALRAIDAGVPVVISTGCSREEATSSVREQGARALLHKPFEVSELLGVVNRAFDEVRAS